jgi:hypothetical protein
LISFSHRARNDAGEVHVSCVLPARAFPAMLIRLMANDPEYRTEGNWEI